MQDFLLGILTLQVNTDKIHFMHTQCEKHLLQHSPILALCCKAKIKAILQSEYKKHFKSSFKKTGHCLAEH